MLTKLQVASVKGIDKCLVPLSYGICYNELKETNLWAVYCMVTPSLSLRRQGTTPRIREEIRNSKESIATLAKRLSLNPKTVAKWRKSSSVEDKKSGAKQVCSSLSEIEQQVICEFRRTTKLPLDDCYIALKEKIPALMRSNLYRCL